MAYMNDQIFDQGLDYADTFDGGTVNVHVCTSNPGSTAPPTNSQGKATGVTIGATANATGGGRQVATSSISNGSIDGAGGTVTYWSITNSADTTCLASGLLSGSGVAVATGNTFTLDPILLIIRDATSV